MRLVLIAACLILSACASTREASQPYRLADGTALVITGRAVSDDPVFGSAHTLTVTINGDTVIAAGIGRGTADASGTWRGRPVAAFCGRDDDFWSDTYRIKCRITIGGEFAAALDL